MTKDEAIEIYKKYYTGSDASKPIDCLIELGLLKVDPPKTATERALNAINDYLPSTGIPHTQALINLMDGAKVRIIDK